MSNNFGLTNEEQVKALQIILRTRKVSLGILRSNFESSAQASNILSWLEDDGFISMAAGSTTWEINFNKIKDYLPKEEYVESYTKNFYVPFKDTFQYSCLIHLCWFIGILGILGAIFSLLFI